MYTINSVKRSLGGVGGIDHVKSKGSSLFHDKIYEDELAQSSLNFLEQVSHIISIHHGTEKNPLTYSAMSCPFDVGEIRGLEIPVGS